MAGLSSWVLCSCWALILASWPASSSTCSGFCGAPEMSFRGSSARSNIPETPPSQSHPAERASSPRPRPCALDREVVAGCGRVSERTAGDFPGYGRQCRGPADHCPYFRRGQPSHATVRCDRRLQVGSCRPDHHRPRPELVDQVLGIGAADRETLLVLEGAARIEIEGGPVLELAAGDIASLPAGARSTWQRSSGSSPDAPPGMPATRACQAAEHSAGYRGKRCRSPGGMAGRSSRGGLL